MLIQFFYRLFIRSTIILFVLPGLIACGGGNSKPNVIVASSSSSLPSDLSSSTPSLVVAPSELSYPSTLTYTLNEVGLPVFPTVTGSVTHYSVSPALPEGLTIDALSGKIDGTPTTNRSAINYIITAENSAGSTTFSLHVQIFSLLIGIVKEPLPFINLFTDQPYHVGMTISVHISSSTSSGNFYYSVSPDLPAGLTLDDTGIISGIPTVAAAHATYAITVRNEYGESRTSDISFAVRPTPAATTVAATYGIQQIILSWIPINGATYYQVMKKKNTSRSPSIFFWGEPDNDYIDENFILLNTLTNELTDNVPLNLTNLLNIYLVRACNASGCTGSPELSFDQNYIVDYVKASNSSMGNNFGYSLALSKDANTLVIAAPKEAGMSSEANTSIAQAGAVYVYTHSSGSWVQEARLIASHADAQDNFGASLALSVDGNTLIVGADNEASAATGVNGNQENNSAIRTGAVYVFTRLNNTWSKEAYIKASNSDAEDNFGKAVALNADGNILTVGAPGESSNAVGINVDQMDNSISSAGAVYIFTRLNSVWSQQAYVKASNSDHADYFGSAVAINSDGDTLAVGAPGESSNNQGATPDQTNNSAIAAGALYIYTRTNNTWVQSAYLKAPNTNAGDFFGVALALSADGNTLAVGADKGALAATSLNESQSSNYNAGAAYLFVRSENVWLLKRLFGSSTTNTFNLFGGALALSDDGNTLAIGIKQDDSAQTGINPALTDNNAVGAGAVFVYVCSNPPANNLSSATISSDSSAFSSCTQSYFKASNTNAQDYFGTAVALSGDGLTLAVGASNEGSAATGINGNQEDNSALGAGAVYLY